MRRPATVDEARRLRRPLPTRSLSQLRQQAGVSQTALAHQLGISQPTLAATESRRDHRLSTLRAYVAALGGTLEIVAVVDGERFELADV